MNLVTYPVPCACGCQAVTQIEVNLWTGEHRILKPVQDFTFKQRWELVTLYKRLKGLDAFPTWDKLHRARALKRAGEILAFFKMLGDPLSVAKECLEETHAKAIQMGWADRMTLETIIKIADGWLMTKMNGGKRK